MQVKPIVIISSKAGRLGNRLLQSAQFMGNALRHSYRLFNPSLDEYAEFFEGSSRDPLCATPQLMGVWDRETASQLRSVIFSMVRVLSTPSSKLLPKKVSLIDIRSMDEAEKPPVDLNGEMFLNHLRSDSVTLVKGWCFSDRTNLARFRDQIISYHTPVATIREAVGAVIHRARGIGKTLIGVHIRQEDYRRWKGGVHYYEAERYAEWMGQCNEIFDDPVFLICSSNEVDQRTFTRLKTISAPGFPVGDLHALSLCDKIIGPPSTFSLWASFAGNSPLCIIQTRDHTIVPGNFALHY